MRSLGPNRNLDHAIRARHPDRRRGSSFATFPPFQNIASRVLADMKIRTVEILDQHRAIRGMVAMFVRDQNAIKGVRVFAQHGHATPQFPER